MKLHLLYAAVKVRNHKREILGNLIIVIVILYQRRIKDGWMMYNILCVIYICVRGSGGHPRHRKESVGGRFR